MASLPWESCVSVWRYCSVTLPLTNSLSEGQVKDISLTTAQKIHFLKNVGAEELHMGGHDGDRCLCEACLALTDRWAGQRWNKSCSVACRSDRDSATSEISERDLDLHQKGSLASFAFQRNGALLVNSDSLNVGRRSKGVAQNSGLGIHLATSQGAIYQSRTFWQISPYPWVEESWLVLAWPKSTVSASPTIKTQNAAWKFCKL